MEGLREKLAQAKELYQKGEYQKSLPLFQDLLSDPDLIDEGLKGLGFAYLALKNYPLASSTLHSGVSKYPNDLDLRFGYGLALQALGSTELAIAELEKVLAANPTHSAAREHLESLKRAAQTQTPQPVAIVDPTLAASSQPAVAPKSNIPTMLPCPKCRQPMIGQSRLCPHCGSMVDPITGAILSGRAELMGLSKEESIYKGMAWVRIIFGLVFLTIGLMVPIPFIGTFFAIVGSFFILTGIGLLFEVGWIQFISYWSSFLLGLFHLRNIFAAFSGGMPVLAVIDIAAIIVHCLTMWSISKLSDFGA